MAVCSCQYTQSGWGVEGNWVKLYFDFIRYNRFLVESDEFIIFLLVGECPVMCGLVEYVFADPVNITF